jgi:hypothetical protein
MKTRDLLTGRSAVETRAPIKGAVTTPNILWLPGGALAYAGTGAGVMTLNSNMAEYALPDAVTASARGMFPLPPAWAGRVCRAHIAWLPSSAGAGNVYFNSVSIRRVRDGVDIATLEAITTTVDATHSSTTKPAITLVDFSALPTDIAAGEWLSLAVQRAGAHASDTYNATVYLLALGFGLR